MTTKIICIIIKNLRKGCTAYIASMHASPLKITNLYIQTDSSQSDIGCYLLQNGKLVTIASGALKNAEIRYSQVKKEYIAISSALPQSSQFYLRTLNASRFRPQTFRL